MIWVQEVDLGGKGNISYRARKWHRIEKAADMRYMVKSTYRYEQLELNPNGVECRCQNYPTRAVGAGVFIHQLPLVSGWGCFWQALVPSTYSWPHRQANRLWCQKKLSRKERQELAVGKRTNMACYQDEGPWAGPWQAPWVKWSV